MGTRNAFLIVSCALIYQTADQLPVVSGWQVSICVVVIKIFQNSWAGQSNICGERTGHFISYTFLALASMLLLPSELPFVLHGTDPTSWSSDFVPYWQLLQICSFMSMMCISRSSTSQRFGVLSCGKQPSENGQTVIIKGWTWLATVLG